MLASMMLEVAWDLYREDRYEDGNRAEGEEDGCVHAAEMM